MFAGAKTFGFLAFALVVHTPVAAVAQDRKRAYDVPATQFELGTFLISQKNLAGVNEIGTYLPAKWTKFHSDSLDWKLEGALSFFSRPGDNWRSAQAAAGFRYWIDASTSVTPMMRVGIARAASSGRPMFAYGGDVLLQRSFTLDAAGQHEAHRLVVLEAQTGFMAYAGAGGHSSRYGFVIATVAYDHPVTWPGANPDRRVRAKIGVGIENQFGRGRAVDRLFLTSVSLRSEDAATGRLVHKFEVFTGIGMGSQYRVAVGYTRGF